MRVPARRYVSGETMRQEAELLWPRVWLPAAHVAERGQLVRRLGPWRVEMTVGDDLRIDRLDAVDAPPSRPAEPVPVERWAGIWWLRIARDGPALSSHLGPIAPLVEAYALDGWHLELSVRTELACNWKTSVDAHNEGYHVRFVHPELAGMVDDAAERIERLGDHSRIAVPAMTPRSGVGSGLAGPVRAALEDAGIHPDPFESDPPAARPALQRAWRRACHAALSDEQLTDNHLLFVFPNLQLNLHADHGLAFRHWPHPTDPERCTFEQWVLRRHRPDVEAPKPREVAPDDAVFGPVTGADLALLERVQRGLRSTGLKWLHLGARERCIAGFHAALERRGIR